jgi:hypothetical protein
MGGAMSERGILMTPENYWKCEAGSKTQTRRILKVQPEKAGWNAPHSFFHKGEYWTIPNGKGIFRSAIRCPFGMPGDRLYVKEALMKSTKGRVAWRRQGLVMYPYREWQWQKNFLSPLHMPKWAARLWLDITDVRVERLVEISNEDAEAEGCQGREGFDPYEVYAELWDSIHGEGSWNENPWVWVISFKKVLA